MSELVGFARGFLVGLLVGTIVASITGYFVIKRKLISLAATAQSEAMAYALNHLKTSMPARSKLCSQGVLRQKCKYLVQICLIYSSGLEYTNLQHHPEGK